MATPTAILDGMASRHSDKSWAQRHMQAWERPLQGQEASLKQLILGWARYAEEHQKRFGSTVGDDGFLGPAWAEIGKSLRTLLNGDLGRFDGGTLVGAILDIASSAGVKLEE